MEIGDDSNFRYEQEPRAGVAILREDDWDSYEVFEDDPSNPELVPVVIEYIEREGDYYPLPLDTGDMTTSKTTALVFTDEQEQAIQMALAGGTITIEVLTPFGTDTTQVWSIQTYAPGGMTRFGERSFTLTAITQERGVLIEEFMEDGDESANEILALHDDGRGDILVTFPIEQPIPVSETPPVFDIIMQDSDTPADEPPVEIQPTPAPVTRVDMALGDDEAQTVVGIEMITMTPLTHTQVETELPLPKPERVIFDEKKKEIPVAADDLPVPEESAIKIEEPDEILAGIDQLAPYASVKEIALAVEPETAHSSSIIATQKNEKVAVTCEAIEHETIANEVVWSPLESEVEQPQVIDLDIQQLQGSMNEEKQPDRYSSIQKLARESKVKVSELLPGIKQAKIVDEPIRYEQPPAMTESVERSIHSRQEDLYGANEEAVHSSFRAGTDKQSDRESDTRTQRAHEVSAWEVSGFEATYGFFPAVGLTIPGEDDIVIPFQSITRAKRPGQVHRARSSVA